MVYCGAILETWASGLDVFLRLLHFIQPFSDHLPQLPSPVRNIEQVYIYFSINCELPFLEWSKWKWPVNLGKFSVPFVTSLFFVNLFLFLITNEVWTKIVS